MAPLFDHRGGLAADMHLAALARQVDLPLALAELFFLLGRVLAVAVRATDAAFKEWTLLVHFRDGQATGVTLVEAALLQAVINGYAIVEDEAFAFPERVAGRHF